VSVPAELTTLWKDGAVERLEITGLSRTEQARLVETVLGGPVFGATLERLWRITEGNALYLREVIESARTAGDLAPHDEVWRLDGALEPGPALIDLVGLRLGSVSPGEERLIEYIALAEPVDVDIITSVTSPGDIDCAERSGTIVAFAEGDRLRLRLAHPLCGEVVRARTPMLRSRTMLGDLAGALDRRGAQRPDEFLALATWRLGSGGAARSTCCSGPAARLATSSTTGWPNVSLMRQWRCTAERPRRSLERSCLYLAGRFAEAEAQLGAIDEPGATERERADAAMARASNLMWGLDDYVAADRLLTDVCRTVVEADPLDDLHALHARVALAGAVLPNVFELTERVLARPGAGDLARISAAVGRAPALAMAGHTDAALELLDDHMSIAMEHLADYPQGIGTVLISQATGHWFAGNLDRAGEVATDLYDIGVSVRSWDAICAGARSRAWVELAKGRPRTAMRWAREAVAAVPEGDLNGLACWCQSVLAEATAIAGDASATKALADMNATRHPSIRIYDAQIVLANAWVAAMNGETSRAIALFEDGAAAARALGALAVESHLLHDIVRLDQPERVVGRLSQLADQVDGLWIQPFTDHAVALVEGDAESLERVAAVFAGLGASLLAAEAEGQAARAHRRHGLERRRRQATSRSAALAAKCEGGRTPTLLTPETIVPLTRREREIAALAGQGLASPEIARRLTLSSRTVEGHLHRLYAKLGVNRREDLARHGLV